jgi:hypothetical protein
VPRLVQPDRVDRRPERAAGEEGAYGGGRPHAAGAPHEPPAVERVAAAAEQEPARLAAEQVRGEVAAEGVAAEDGADGDAAAARLRLRLDLPGLLVPGAADVDQPGAEVDVLGAERL